MHGGGTYAFEVSTPISLRPATLEDVALLTANVADGFATYLEWAPPNWTPPVLEEASMNRQAERLAREDVWCLIALDAGEAAGHIGLSPVTAEEPEPAGPGAIYLWQLFVRERWRGSGLATQLVTAAVEEAKRRDLTKLILWTPRGAGRSRRFYEREGWIATGRSHEDSPSGLPTVEYSRSTAD